MRERHENLGPEWLVSVVGAFLEWDFLVHKDAHVCVWVVQPPGADPEGGFQPEVFPIPPDCFHTDQGFGEFYHSGYQAEAPPSLTSQT